MKISHPTYTINGQEAIWINKNLRRDAFGWIAITTIWSTVLYFAIQTIWPAEPERYTIIMNICMFIVLTPSVALACNAIINLLFRNSTHFEYTAATIINRITIAGKRKNHYYADIVLSNGMTLSNVSIDNDIFNSKTNKLIVVLRNNESRFAFDETLTGWTAVNEL